MVRSIWCGFRPEADRERALGVEVDEQHLAAELGERGAQVDRGRGLADATLLVAHRDDPGVAVAWSPAAGRAGRASGGRWGRARPPSDAGARPRLVGGSTSGAASRRPVASATRLGAGSADGCDGLAAAPARGGAGGRCNGGISEAELPKMARTRWHRSWCCPLRRAVADPSPDGPTVCRLTAKPRARLYAPVSTVTSRRRTHGIHHPNLGIRCG